ncbi:COR domain-containing protein [Candidatus Magnetominusculus dajiuhuensis]|uniref:COR domain-containing protein n=1 Tax=Candidatus Magnetominusculus dajiuhuensis TaxID=3137712 RepID=UPI003B4293C7
MTEKEISEKIEAAKTRGGLDLSRAGLEELPTAIGDLKNLTSLLVWGNKLKELPAFIGDLKNLTSLSVANNKLKELPAFIGDLKNLTSLSVANNQLKELPTFIGDLKNLTSLSVSGNQLKELPTFIANIEKLNDLYINDNPLEFPPPEILKQGTFAIKEYLKGFSDGKGRKLYEAKLLVVGEGGVGKTSLCKRLIDDKFDDKESTTEGIAIEDWRLRAIDTEQTEIKLNVWDFGGQEIYHSTHQFFLTKRSVYLLVWDARQEDKYGQLDYWLYTIEALGEDSPVILILNKCDERVKDINLLDLKEQFPNIREFYRVSCKDPQKGKNPFDQLTDEITETAWTLPLMGTHWIQSWLDVRNHLESLAKEKNQIEYSEYLTICKDKGIEKKAANVLSGYLHDLGVILHFQNDQLLKHTIILNPEWGTKAVYKVLDTEKISDQMGIVYECDYDDIWTESEGYPQPIHKTLVRLMANFDLAFQMKDTGNYVVAELLPFNPPPFEWDDDKPLPFGWDYNDNLIFQYQYNFMPAGVMPRFIVRIHEYIERDADDNKYMCWKLGVFLKWNNTRAFIKAFPTDKRIEVRVTGKRKDELLTIIRMEFESINKRFKKLVITENIPCACSEGCEYLFEYEYLKEMKDQRKSTVSCHKTAIDVPISTLLEGVKPTEAELERDVERKFRGGFLTEVRDVAVDVTSKTFAEVIKSFLGM